MLVPGRTGRRTVEVDTPELRELKAEAGIEDCAPGPGGGALPAVTLACLGGGPAVDLSSLRGPMVINMWQSGLHRLREGDADPPGLPRAPRRPGGRCWASTRPTSTPGPRSSSWRTRGVTYPSLADPGGDLLDTDEFAQVRGYPYLAFVDERRRRSPTRSSVAWSRPTSSTTWSSEHLGVGL